MPGRRRALPPQGRARRHSPGVVPVNRQRSCGCRWKRTPYAGIFWSAFAVGNLEGALAAGPAHRWPARWTLAAAVLWGLFTGPLAWVRSLPTALVLVFLAGAAFGPYPVLSFTLRQVLVPREVLGRVLSFTLVITQLGVPAGAWLGGRLVDALGAPMAMGLAGAGCMALGLVAALCRDLGWVERAPGWQSDRGNFGRFPCNPGPQGVQLLPIGAMGPRARTWAAWRKAASRSPQRLPVMVRGDEPGHRGLAQAGAGVDHHLVQGAADRAGGEQDPGALGRDHPLHHHRHPHPLEVDAPVVPVGHGAVGPEGGPAVADGVQQGLFPHQSKEGIVLAGEGGARQVLGGGAGTHRHRPAAKGGVGAGDGVVDGLRDGQRRKRRPQGRRVLGPGREVCGGGCQASPPPPRPRRRGW